MADIYAMMGVCPQHDLLWDTLTGREHLLFYGRLKNLKVKAHWVACLLCDKEFTAAWKISGKCTHILVQPHCVYIYIYLYMQQCLLYFWHFVEDMCNTQAGLQWVNVSVYL